MPKDYIKCVRVIRTEENFQINDMASFNVFSVPSVATLLSRDSRMLRNISEYAVSDPGFEHMIKKRESSSSHSDAGLLLFVSVGCTSLHSLQVSTGDEKGILYRPHIISRLRHSVAW